MPVTVSRDHLEGSSSVSPQPVPSAQSVVVTYTDPTAGDGVAIEDALGNETPRVTTGSDGVLRQLHHRPHRPRADHATANVSGTGIELVFSKILDYPSTEAE